MRYLAALIALALPLAGCSATLAPSDAGPARDAQDAATDDGGPCRWQVVGAAQRVLPSDVSSQSLLLGVTSTAQGAWVAWMQFASQPGEGDTVRVRALDARGVPLETGSSVVWSRPLGASIPGFSMAEGAALVEGLEGCDLVRLDARARPLSAPRRVPEPAVPGFSLSGCHYLSPTPSGWSYLSTQVRALWGITLVRLGPEGSTLGGQDLEFPVDPVDGFVRDPADDGFFVAWTELRTGPPSLRVRRYTHDGAPRAEAVTVHQSASLARTTAPRVLSLPSGALALWAEAGGTAETQGVRARPLDATGAPRGAARALFPGGFYNRGFAATATRGVALVAAVLGSGVLRTQVQALDTTGTPLGEPFPVETEGAPDLRLVATPEGALLVWGTESSRDGWRISAVPLGCAP